jgi:hypothetical protein
MLPGGDAEVVQQEIEELTAKAADEASAGAPEDAQADAVNGFPPCAGAVADRVVLLTAESALDGEPIIIFVVASEEAEDSTDSSAETPEALIFKIADCSVADLG